MSEDATGTEGLGAEALSRMAQDEAMARYLQAMDNGLRSRKRSTSSTSSPYSMPHEDSTPSRRRAKAKLASPAAPSPSKKASPGRNGSKRDSVAHDGSGHHASARSRGMSPDSGSVSPHSSKSEADSPAPTMRYCQGCGQSLMRRGLQALESYNCDECIALYSLPHPLASLSPKSPSSSTSSSHWPASPAHKCPGCSLSFLFQDRLREHQDRVHV